MFLMLLSACATAPSNGVVPAVREYTKKQKENAADEMEKYCNVTPVLCTFIIDYDKMRQKARVARSSS